MGGLCDSHEPLQLKSLFCLGFLTQHNNNELAFWPKKQCHWDWLQMSSIFCHCFFCEVMDVKKIKQPQLCSLTDQDQLRRCHLESIMLLTGFCAGNIYNIFYHCCPPPPPTELSWRPGWPEFNADASGLICEREASGVQPWTPRLMYVSVQNNAPF